MGEIWEKRGQPVLTSDEPTLAPAAEILERSTDRKSRVAVNGHEPQPTLAYQLSYALQRAFDRSKALDPYALRALAAGSKSNKLTSARTALENCIGRQMWRRSSTVLGATTEKQMTLRWGFGLIMQMVFLNGQISIRQ